MDAVTSGNIQIDSEIKIKYVTALKISVGVQEHGICKMSGLLEDGIETQQILAARKEIAFCVVWNGESSGILFRGILKKAKVHAVNGVYHIEIYAVTVSEKLDREKRQRSFQDTAMTYEQVVRRILASYGSLEAKFTEQAQETIGEPIIQYGETDWQFLKRLGSHLHIPLYADICSKNRVLCLGMEKGVHIEAETDTYRVGISQEFYRTNHGKDSVPRKDYIYYRVRSGKNGKIGDMIDVGLDQYVIYKKSIELVKESLDFIYYIGKRGNWYIPYIEHDCLTGMEFIGKVIATQREEMKINLRIDEPYNGADYKWEWTPVTGNIMYAIPEIGSDVRLYFGSGTASEGMAFVNQRYNGEDMPEQQKRVFTTAAEKKMTLYPEQLAFQGAGGQTAIADGKAVTLGSTAQIEMTANGKIRLEATKIHVYTPQEINMYRG